MPVTDPTCCSSSAKPWFVRDLIDVAGASCGPVMVIVCGDAIVLLPVSALSLCALGLQAE